MKINTQYLRAFFLTVSVLAFSGCFETEFKFQTIVHPDGSVYRETKIDGRGAHMFKAPSGPGWEVKTWETKGAETFLFDTYYHILAHGRFRAHEVITPDFQYDIEKNTGGEIEEADLKQFEEAGIPQPYLENVFSRNEIKINALKGWLTTTFIYEESFRNAGVIELLLLDVKEEIRKQNQLKKIEMTEDEVFQTAVQQLENEYLSAFRFRSELLLPGKIVSTNAHRLEKGKAVWEFSMKDFEDRFSGYSLKAVSRSLKISGIIFLIAGGVVAFALIILIVIGMRTYKKGSAEGKRKKKKT